MHILDLQQTVPMLDRALRALRDVTAAGGRVLFVGTKRAAAEYIADSATRCGQYYVNHRWLGGMLTNWKTITGSIKRLRQMEEQLGGNIEGLTKKEVLDMTRDREKLERSLGGIKEMGGLPDILFIIDTNKEKLAVEEANKLGIPVIAILDSNSDPKGVTYPIPGNDDAIRAITMYCDLAAGAVLETLGRQIGMHVAATSPEALDTSAVDPAALEREKAVLTEQARASGKPDNIIEKMVEGRIRKYYEEVVLLEQVWVHDGESRVKAVVKKAGAELIGFARFKLGDGNEKAAGDFAAEVKAAAGVG